MKDNKINIDQLFLQELGAHTESPPALVWENLEKRLDKKSNITKRYWWFYMLVIGLFFCGSIAAFYQWSNADAVPKVVSASNKNNLSHMAGSNSISTIASGTIGNLETIENSPTNNFGNNINGNTQNNSPKTDNTKSNTFSSIDNDKRIENSAINSIDNNTIDRTKKNSSKSNIAQINAFSAIDNGDKLAKTQASTANRRVPRSGLMASNNKAQKPTIKVRNTQTATSDNNKGLQGSTKAAGATKTTNATKASLDANKVANIQKPTNKNIGSNSSALNTKAKSNPTLVSGEKEQNTNDNNSAAKTAAKPINVSSQPEAKKEISKPFSEKASAKPIVVTAKEKVQNRGLSAFPEEDAAELQKDDADTEDITDFTPEKPAKEKPKPLLAVQSEAINKARAQNPLAAMAMASAAIDEAISADNEDSKSNASGGGGGGGAAAKKTKIKKPLNMAIGVKMGYERGFQKITSDKYVGTIFAEVNLSNKLSFVMQPSLKFGKANQTIGGATVDTFTNAEAASRSKTAILDSLGVFTGFYNYNFSQNIDSMSQTTSFEKKFIEIEIPFLFRYKIDKNFSVLAGINFIFGKTLGFSFSEQKFSSSQISDSVKNVFDTTKVALPSRFLPQGINGKSTLSSDLSAPISPVRFGYTLGLSYVFKEKFLVDLLVQQNLSGVSNISNNEVRKIFSQPYVRLSLGYTILGKSKK